MFLLLISSRAYAAWLHIIASDSRTSAHFKNMCIQVHREFLASMWEEGRKHPIQGRCIWEWAKEAPCFSGYRRHSPACFSSSCRRWQMRCKGMNDVCLQYKKERFQNIILSAISWPYLRFLTGESFTYFHRWDPSTAHIHICVGYFPRALLYYYICFRNSQGMWALSIVAQLLFTNSDFLILW